MYTDTMNPESDMIRWDDNPQASGDGLSGHEKVVQWKRISETYKAEDGYSLWGDNGISLHDIRQG